MNYEATKGILRAKMLDLAEIKAKYPLGGRPKAFNSPEEMLDKLYAFLLQQENRVVELITKNGVQTLASPAPITIEGFCTFAGITKTTFYCYAKKPKYRMILEQFRQNVEKYLVEQCVEGKPGNKADFILRNAFYDYWKDKKDIELSGDIKMMPTVKIDGEIPEVNIGEIAYDRTSRNS